MQSYYVFHYLILVINKIDKKDARAEEVVNMTFDLFCELGATNEQLDFNKIEEKIIDSTPKEEIVEVNLSELRSNPYQPRKVF